MAKTTKTPAAGKRKQNPQDATLRNTRAARRQVDLLRGRVDALTAQLNILRDRVFALENDRMPTIPEPTEPQRKIVRRGL
jgi:hypothetical protein